MPFSMDLIHYEEFQIYKSKNDSILNLHIPITQLLQQLSVHPPDC